MANDYSDIGLCINSREELIDYAYANADRTEFRKTERGEYGRLDISNELELWYYGDENGVEPLSMEMCFNSGHTMRLSDFSWISFPEDRTDSVLLNGLLDEGETGFYTNVEIVNACEFIGGSEETLSDDACELDLTLFARDFEVFGSEEEYYNAHTSGMASESCIPYGAFPLPGMEEGFEPAATVMLNGTVISAERLTNPETGLKFWYVLLACMGMEFSMVAADELIENELIPGNVVKGSYWVSGKLLRVL